MQQTEKQILNSTPQDSLAIYVSADQLTAKQSNQFEISGNVSIKNNRHSIKADKAQYNRTKNQLSAQGNITYREESLLIKSDNLNLNLASNAGNAENTRYTLPNLNINGTAGEITFKDEQVKLEESTYSTCPDEGKGKEKAKAWQVRAKVIELHPEKNEIIARDMRLEIANIPVIYLPYISLPLKGRKSGFLAPQPGYSSDKGYDVAIPYYLNLKPNYDLAVTPRAIETRGAQISGEFRYLQKKTSGSVGAEILPDDKQTQTTRSYINLSHRSQLSDNSSYEIDYSQVSDKAYFSNLGTALNTVNRSNLNRRFLSETRGENWLFNTTIQDFQMLDQNQEPYRRIPQFDLRAFGKAGFIQWQSNTQYSYFQKNNQDYIHRALLLPEVSLPIKRQYGYFTPSLGLRAALYQSSMPENNKQRLINWQFNTKTGLFFERETESAFQTLTPELQYSYIPYKNQNSLPIIDTDVLYFDIEQLFTQNRYSGYDRLGDQNRLSWSLSADYTRNDREKPLFYAKFAQAKYLADQQTRLVGEKQIRKNELVSAAIIKSNFSNTLSGKIQGYHFLGDKRLNNGNVSLNYKKTQEQVELSYRYVDQSIKQVSVIGVLDVASRWRIASRWLYSLNSERTREALLGLEYNSCCWAIRLMGRQYTTLNAGTNETNLRTSVGLQIELKGLTKIGSNLDKQFSDEVFGNQ